MSQHHDHADQADDRLHDDLHSAAEHFAANLNNCGIDTQNAFLLACGIAQADIDAVLAADPDDEMALDDLVIDVCSRVASDAYNHGRAPKDVEAELDQILAAPRR